MGLIPAFTALALVGLRAQADLRSADTFQQTAAQVDLVSKTADVVHLLQGERMLAMAKMVDPGDTQAQAALNSQIAQVDGAVAALRTEASKRVVSDPASQRRYDAALQRLDALAPLRASVNTPPYSELAAFTSYTSVLDALVQLGREMNATVTDQGLLRDGTTLQAVTDAKEFTAREDAALEIAVLRNGFSTVVLDQIRGAEFSAAAATDVIKFTATPDQFQQFTDTVAGPDVDGRAQLVATALAHADSGSPPGISRDALASHSAVNLDKLRTFQTSLLDDLRSRANQLAAAATTAAWRDSVIVFLVLALGLICALLIMQTMLKPLRVLRRSALDIAHKRLPETVHKILQDADPVAASKNAIEPVPVTTLEEVGEVARSFDAVHEQAIKLAAEQALLRENVNGIFVNLSRRSQRLVERQLGVIDRLEADEQDPDHLASLFELDHLATRLRRNGESLLVLSGAGLAKSVPKPVPAADVIGAAVSEIEQYGRVDVGTIPDVAVRGLTVHDLVHLLAELLDNATYFSEPETKVSVRAVVTRRKALAVQITDRGVGISEAHLAEANKRLADPPDLDVSVTRRMGLYVVARLAQRHGIEVRLRENEDIEGGVIARIVVPAELLGAVAAESPVPLDAPGEISWPSTESSSPGLSTVPAQRPRPASAAEQTSADRLKPLDQPISLDDLVAGSAMAAFVSQGKPSPAPSENGHIPVDPGRPGPLVLPKREPQPVPAENPEASQSRPEGPLESHSESSLPPVTDDLTEDDVPTKRLPIYQSVVSRWFSAEGDGTIAEDLVPMPAENEEHAEAAREAVSETQASAENPWRSASDEGWLAARTLLDAKNDETTSAGLPKRVPNAHLMPGSVPVGEPDSFVDTTLGRPGHSAITRSATAARERMVSFQQGYTSGRHALGGGTGDESVSVSGGERPSPEAVRSEE